MKSRALRAALGALAAACAVFAVACPPKDEPFPFDYHGTPTPSPTPDPVSTPERIITHKYDVISAGETVKIAQWDDNKLHMLNFLAGYVLVFGLDHPVELVELADREYGEALLSGGVHVALHMEQAWHESTGEAAGILDVGTLYDNGSDLRIGVIPSLRDADMRITAFLSAFKPGDEAVEALSSRITGGRIGMRPNVAALKYFKENAGAWREWIDAEAATAVQVAIDEGKTGLINRRCIPDGGNDNCVR